MGEIIVTTAAAWGVFLVAGAGVAVLPWTDRESREVTTALAAIPGIVRRLTRTRRPAFVWRGAWAGELSSLS